MADRNNTIHGNQIKDRTLTKAELDATGESVGKTLVVQSNGSVDWQFLTNLTDYIKLQDNIMLNAFRIAVNGSLTQFNMLDGIVDYYFDETGIDSVNSINAYYDSSNKLYSPLAGANTKLLLHLNGTDGATSTSDASPNNHTINFNGNAQLDTAIKKFGASACLFDGSGDYLDIDDSTDWDVFANTSDNWTIDFWIYTNETATDKVIIGQYEDISNRWDVLLNDEELLRFRLISGTGNVTVSTTTALTTGTWHHIACIKVADEYGIYLDGNQIAYVQSTNTDTFSGSLYIGSRDGSNDFLDGSLDEIRIIKSNAFNASPNSSKTDTISVPSGEHSLDGGNMTLISESFSAETQPDSGRIVILEEDVDSITLNTDLKVYASRDGGSSWVQGTFIDEGDYDASKRILVADFDFTQSGIGSGTTMKYKFITDNNKDLKLHASSLNWD